MKNLRKQARHHVSLILILTGLINAAILSSLPRFAFAQVVGPSWTYTGSLKIARYGHTATLLPNGKVLVVGGDTEGKGAELYDPDTGVWSTTGSLNIARYYHTATLLPNGKVLVAGGSSDVFVESGITDSAELYDPAAGVWSNTGNLNKALVFHTATLLTDGKVLVAGGANFNEYVSHSELYDPSTGTWSYSGHLNMARIVHTATLLPNGKVLVAGGLQYPVALNSAEVYDPATGTWGNTGNLNISRDTHTATLLRSGKVLVAGGLEEDFFSARLLDSAELYDPATGTWSSTGALNNFRWLQSATLLPNGEVLVAGGSNGEVDLSSAELYDVDSGTWSITASLNTARSSHIALLTPNGKVLVAGGGYPNPLNSAELYDSGANSNRNQIDDAQFFVHQHYSDFLNREPDPAGLAFWTNEINSCGSDAQCIEVKRINVSAAFYLSIEFQQTGFLVYRLHKAAFGNLPGTPVPLRLSELLPDTQQIGQGVIVNQPGWEQKLETNKQVFAAEFVQRPRFTSAYHTSMTAAEFVDALFANAGVSPSSADRAAAIGEFDSAATSSDTGARARALRRVVENPTLTQQEFNRAFVLMQYFGYLRRNPNDAPEPELNFNGYNFWLNKLDSFNGDFVQAEMVKAFIASTEYRQRFGQP